jgi:hypothetical protein
LRARAAFPVPHAAVETQRESSHTYGGNKSRTLPDIAGRASEERLLREDVTGEIWHENTMGKAWGIPLLTFIEDELFARLKFRWIAVRVSD